MREDRAGFLDGFTTDFFSVDGELKVSEEQRRQALALEEPARDEAVVACIDSFGRTDFRKDLERISVPTLVIHGDSDSIVPLEVSGRRTADSVDSARLVVVEGAPHGSTSATPTSSTSTCSLSWPADPTAKCPNPQAGLGIRAPCLSRDDANRRRFPDSTRDIGPDEREKKNAK